MTPEDWQKVKELCHLALEQPPEQGSAFWAKACPNDETLQREIESMIVRYTAGKAALDAPVWESLNPDKAAEWRPKLAKAQ